MRRVEIELKLSKLERAYSRLVEAVEEAKTELERDGAIQRFEFVVELLWKTLKAVLEYHYVECFSPRDCVKKAFRRGLLDDDKIVMDMLQDRNFCSHIYDVSMAMEIFERIREIYVRSIGEVISSLTEKL